MRMLQSELMTKRAAVTVSFNAWHHQKEDQLLACLMEATAKGAAERAEDGLRRRRRQVRPASAAVI